MELQQNNQLKAILEQFWRWANYTPVEYAKIAFLSFRRDGHEECDFPLYAEMADQAIAMLRYNTIGYSDMDDFLTAMAINGESGWILDECQDSATDDFFQQIIAQGSCHLQPEARRQIAELLRRRETPNRMEYLNKLLQDPIEYVRRYAKNMIEFIIEDSSSS